MIKSDVSHGGRRCNVALTLEMRKPYMLTFAKQSNFWRDFYSAMAERWKGLKTSNVVSSLIVCSNRNIYQLWCVICYNSLFVDQLYEDKSLALRARDLIFFTTDIQTVKSLPELIFFLNNKESIKILLLICT